MSPINVVSTTDSQENVIAAIGDQESQKNVVEQSTSDTKTQDDPKDTETNESHESDGSQGNEVSEDKENEHEELEDKPEDEIEAKADENIEEKPKKKSGFQKRVNKLNQKLAAAEQEKEYWREAALKQKSSDQQIVKKDEIKTSEQSKRPNPNDFASHDEYVEALTDWKLDQKLMARDQKQKEEEIKSKVKTEREQHKERVIEFAKTHDDWDEVIENVGDVPLSLAVEQAFIESENGPALMYELAKDPSELKRICSLPPMKAGMEIGKIEARISKSSNSSKEKTKTSKAPPPVSTVKGKGFLVPKSIYDPTLTQHEFNKLRAEQLRVSRR